MNVEEAVLAALQCAEEELGDCPHPFWRSDGKLGLFFKNKEYVASIEDVP